MNRNLPVELVTDILELAVAVSPWLDGDDDAEEAAIRATYPLLLAALLINSTWNVSDAPDVLCACLCCRAFD